MPNPMAHPDGPGSQATPEAPVPVSSPVGADPLRAALSCDCGGQPRIWKGNSSKGKYAYVECPECHRSTVRFSTVHQAKMMWFIARDSDAGLAEDGASRLNREAAAARAEGIAHNQSEAPNGD